MGIGPPGGQNSPQRPRKDCRRRVTAHHGKGVMMVCNPSGKAEQRHPQLGLSGSDSCPVFGPIPIGLWNLSFLDNRLTNYECRITNLEGKNRWARLFSKWIDSLLRCSALAIRYSIFVIERCGSVEDLPQLYAT
jgi:hypothetical protein